MNAHLKSESPPERDLKSREYEPRLLTEQDGTYIIDAEFILNGQRRPCPPAVRAFFQTFMENTD